MPGTALLEEVKRKLDDAAVLAVQAATRGHVGEAALEQLLGKINSAYAYADDVLTGNAEVPA